MRDIAPADNEATCRVKCHTANTTALRNGGRDRPTAIEQENTTTDEDRAWLLCLDLSEEYGYAQVLCNGVIIGEYTNGQ